jgi:hypothetical protein
MLGWQRRGRRQPPPWRNMMMSASRAIFTPACAGKTDPRMCTGAAMTLRIVERAGSGAWCAQVENSHCQTQCTRRRGGAQRPPRARRAQGGGGGRGAWCDACVRGHTAFFTRKICTAVRLYGCTAVHSCTAVCTVAQAPSAARGLVGVYGRTVPCHFCPYSPWSCSPSARSGTQARLGWHLWGTLMGRCAQSRNFPRGGRTPMGPLPWAPMVRPTPPRRKVGEVRPNRGFVALSQVLRGAAAILWSCTPTHGGFLLPPPPPSISWPLCTGPIAWSAVEGACCVCRGGPNQAPCPRTFLCLPRLSLLPVCLSLLSCLTGASTGPSCTVVQLSS